MNMNINISPQAETRLHNLAIEQGVDPSLLVGKLLEEQLASVPEGGIASPGTTSAPVIEPKAAAAIAWLNQRIADEATDDPDEIRKADEEVAELKRNLNANRAATGERLVSR